MILFLININDRKNFAIRGYDTETIDFAMLHSMGNEGFMRKRRFLLLAIFLMIIWTGILFTGIQRQYHVLKDIEKKCVNMVIQLGFSNVSYLQGNSPDNGSPWCERVALLQYINSQKMGDGAVAVMGIQNAGSSVASGAGTEIVTGPLDEVENITVFNNGSFDITAYNRVIKILKPETQTAQNAEQNPSDNTGTTEASAELKDNMQKIQELKKNRNRSYLLKNFYIVDSSTSIDKKIFQPEKLLSYDVAMKQNEEPQILIYHTHGASEAFVDSKAGVKNESIIGVGEELANILTKEYGYHVIHDETEYDKVNGSIDRNKAYNQSYDGVSKTLQKYPGIQVTIDLHRDGVGNKVQRLTTINGKRTAQVMFFNGLSRNSKGDIAYLHNDNLQANLAFSLQMKLTCMENYPDFAKPIYLKNYRYNLHLKERALLIELGNENNTLQEAKNAMEPLAKVLHQVLSGESNS